MATNNIERLDPVGEPFDPNLHEAMFEVPGTEHPNGTVAMVVQPGYRLHDRLLRPARVGVAKSADGNFICHFFLGGPDAATKWISPLCLLLEITRCIDCRRRNVRS